MVGIASLPKLGFIDVRVVLLSQLRCGDIILETGDPQIATAGGGLFGHASVALGQLVRIEAGKLSGVELNPFEFATYQKNDHRILGVAFTSNENVCVLRRKQALDDGTLKGEALWEAGRTYSVQKLLELPDLPDISRKGLERRLGREQAPDPKQVREGRFCSEVAAKVLRLNQTIVSPNGLADAKELRVVEDAVADLDQSWATITCDPRAEAIPGILDKIRLGLADFALGELQAAAGRICAIPPSPTSVEEADAAKKAEPAAMEKMIVAEIADAIKFLHSLDELASELLTPTSPI